MIGVNVDAPAGRMRQAVVLGPGFRPPAIGNAEIQRAIRGGFHAAGAAGFVGLARHVQPDIGTTDQHASELRIVLLEEHKTIPYIGAFAELEYAADELLSTFIARVRLAGKNKL